VVLHFHFIFVIAVPIARRDSSVVIIVEAFPLEEVLPPLLLILDLLLGLAFLKAFLQLLDKAEDLQFAASVRDLNEGIKYNNAPMTKIMPNMKNITYLLSLDLLWVEIVCLGYIEVGSDILIVHGLEHAFFDGDLVEVLIVVLVLKVVHDRDLGWIVLYHELSGH
jgi:hypothetical protein